MGIRDKLSEYSESYVKAVYNGWFYTVLAVTVALNLGIVMINQVPVVGGVVRLLSLIGAVALLVDTVNVKGYGISRLLVFVILAPLLTVIIPASFVGMKMFVYVSAVGLVIYTVSSSLRSDVSFWDFGRVRQGVTVAVLGVVGVVIISVFVLGGGGTGSGPATPVETPDTTTTQPVSFGDVNVSVDSMTDDSGELYAYIVADERGDYKNIFGYTVNGESDIKWAGEGETRIETETVEQGDVIEVYVKQDGKTEKVGEKKIVGSVYTIPLEQEKNGDIVGYSMIVDTVSGATVSVGGEQTTVGDSGVVAVSGSGSDVVSVSYGGETLYESSLKQAHDEKSYSDFSTTLETSETLEVGLNMNGVIDCSDVSVSVDGASVEQSNSLSGCYYDTESYSTGDTVVLKYKGQTVAVWTVE